MSTLFTRSTPRTRPLMTSWSLRCSRDSRSYSKPTGPFSPLTCAHARRNRSKSRLGYLSTALASLFGFLPAKSFASPEQLSQWKEQALATAEKAPAGLRKQLELQIEWFLNPESVEAE